MPQLLAFDLDDTLAVSKQAMTARMGLLLSQVMTQIPVAVMSGGAFLQFERQFLSRLPEGCEYHNLYLFPCNAAIFYRNNNGVWEKMYDFSFTEKERTLIIGAVDQALAQVGLLKEPEKIWGVRLEDRGAQFSFSPLGQFAPLEEKTKWRAENEPLRQKLRSILADMLPEFSVATGGITTTDITRKGITKEYGVQKLFEVTSIPISEMLYVGDALFEGGNDAVVIPTGIQTHEVSNPEDTVAYIESLLSKL